MKKIKIALTVASSDSGCGAGVQADMLSIAQNGVFATMAIASLTAQNPNKVTDIAPLPASFLKSQLDTVNSYFEIDALKCGMLYDKANIEILADFVEANPHIRFVADTVMIATSLAKLLKDDAIESLERRLLPLAELITPNLDEAKALLNSDDFSNLEEMSKHLSQKYNTSVLLKGGHLEGDDIEDILYLKSGKIYKYKTTRIKNINTHGSGCTLSACICANFAKGLSIAESVERARAFLLKGMRKPVKIGDEYFINHLVKL
ncbi:MAG: bifunctional hydroxymethylpyrimidine kinase/phosphomethylpyrimidine kinase [Opitutales bacterium]